MNDDDDDDDEMMNEMKKKRVIIYNKYRSLLVNFRFIKCNFISLLLLHGSKLMIYY